MLGVSMSCAGWPQKAWSSVVGEFFQFESALCVRRGSWCFILFCNVFWLLWYDWFVFGRNCSNLNKSCV